MKVSKKSTTINRLMGNMFYQIRVDKGLTQEEVARNIISQKAVSKFEKIGDMPNFLVLRAMMQRMGESMDYFTTMLSKREYDYLAWRKEILKQIQENRVEESVWTCEMARDRTLNSNLQEQFLKFWNGYCNNDVELMKEAIFLTVENPATNSKKLQRMSTTEISYLLIYFEKKAELHKKLDEANLKLLSEIVKYLRESDENLEKVKVFGKAVCLYGTYVSANSSQRLILYKEALELQRKLARLDGITDLLRGLLEQYNQLGIIEEENYSGMLEALISIEKEFGVSGNSFVVQGLNTEYVLLHEVLRSYRKERKLSVSEIDEHACSEKTYRALENGKRAANHSTYEILAELMDIRIGKYHADIISDKYSDYKLAGEIVVARQSQRQTESMLLINKLEKSLGELANLNVNKQFIIRWRNIQDFYDEKIGPMEFVEKVKKTIRLTIPHWDLNYGPHFYLKTELILVYYIAMAYRTMGKAKEALNIIEKVWNIYDTREVDAYFNMEESLLFLVFWKNLLTDCKEYEKALKLTVTGIKMCFSSGKGGKLNNFVYELGWNMERRSTGLSEKEKKAECMRYFQYAFSLCQLFHRKSDEKAVNKHCKENGYKLN